MEAKKTFFLQKKTGPRRGARDRAGPAPHQVRDRPGGRGGRQHHGQVRHDAHRQVPRGHTATPGDNIEFKCFFLLFGKNVGFFSPDFEQGDDGVQLQGEVQPLEGLPRHAHGGEPGALQEVWTQGILSKRRYIFVGNLNYLLLARRGRGQGQGAGGAEEKVRGQRKGEATYF